MQEQGGWWGMPAARASSAPRAAPPAHPPVTSAEPEFDGAAGAFPFHFLPYASQALGDGSLAHLPWLQELPDVMTSAMWSSWVEVNPRTARESKIETGDVVELTSQHGTLRAPAIVSPGIAPDVLAMPIGQGHQSFGRYADGRGANPQAILAPVAERETGALAWAATRVKLTRIGKSEESKLILYAGGMSGFPVEEEPR
jgi:anaerobic selenocysteine-containing dehydrogenase